MKKYTKLLAAVISAVMLFSMVFGNCINAFAAGKKEILKSAGFKDYFIEQLDDEEISKYAIDIKNGTGNVDKTEIAYEIDNIREIQDFVNTDKNELIYQGATRENIEATQKEIDYISSSTPEELSKKCNVSIPEAKMLIEATKIDNDYKAQNCTSNDMAIASGSISSAKLSLTMGKEKTSAKRPTYNINIAYNWKSPYVCKLYSDAIAVAWAGGFTCNVKGSTANYYKSSLAQGWITSNSKMYDSSNKLINANHVTYKWTEGQKKPNTGVSFNAKQSRSVYQQTSAENKSGSIKLQLVAKSATAKGENCEVVAQYAHYRTNVAISINFKSASITFSTTCDKSEPAYTKITN